MKLLVFSFTLVFVISNESRAADDEKQFDTSQVIADWVDRNAKLLDLSLSGSQYTKKREDSHLIVTQELLWDESEGFQYDLDFDLDLALPNLQKKYKLLISNYNRNKELRSFYSRRNRRQNNRGDDFGATIAIMQKIGDFDVSFEPRLNFSNGFGTFYALLVENDMKFGKYDFNINLSFFADSEKGTGQFVGLRLLGPLSKKWSQSITFEEEYQDAESLLTTLHAYSVFYNLTDTMVLSQSFIVSSDNEESFKIVEIDVGPSFTHKVFRNEFHYSINYTARHRRDSSFRPYSIVSFLTSFIF